MKRNAHALFFDWWSGFYGSTPLLTGHLRRMQKKASAALLLPRGARVLDLGCGPGDGLGRMRRAGMNTVGGDLSRAMIERARLQGPVARISAVEMPFRDASFDGVLCTNSFHHYPDPVESLRQMHRVLRLGGRLVIVDPCGDDLVARTTIHVGERLLFGMKDVHLHTRREWKRMLEEAGFDAISIRRAGRLDPRERASVLVSAVAG